MEKRKLDWIIGIIREEGMGAGAVSGAPTNHTGPHVAEYPTPLGSKKRKKTIGVWARSLRKKGES